MRFLSTLFVIAMTLTACTGGQDNNKESADYSRRAVGVDSKTGKSISSKELCGDLKTDGVTGEVTVESLRFNASSNFVRRTLVIDHQIQYRVKKKTRGSWGLHGDSLLLNETGKLTQLPIKEVSNGTKTCYQLGQGETLSTYCPCD